MSLHAVPELSLVVISLVFVGLFDIKNTIFTVLVIAFSSFIVVSFQIFRKGISPPKLYYQKNNENEQLLKLCPSLFVPFSPSFVLFNGHLQSMATALRKNPNTLFKREEVHFPDGGYSAIDWTENEYEVAPTTPTIFILHGLAGGSAKVMFGN